MNESVGIVTGPICLPEIFTWVENTWAMSRKINEMVRKIKWSSSMNMMVRRNCFFEVGGFSEHMLTCEDIDFSYKIIEKKRDIIFDQRIQVIHIGEAKTLVELFKKERWRGASALQLFRNNIGDINRWYSIGQLIFFMASIIAFIVCLIKGDLFHASFFFLCIILLPLLRAFLISNNNRQYNKVPPLVLVWIIYYLARSTALFYDSFINYFLKPLLNTMKYGSRKKQI